VAPPGKREQWKQEQKTDQREEVVRVPALRNWASHARHHSASVQQVLDKTLICSISSMVKKGVIAAMSPSRVYLRIT
jgi:hypothetical protein